MDQEFIDQVYARLEYESSRSGPPGNFPALPPIPPGRYRDPQFLQLENDYLWSRSWLYACHADQLSAPGSFMLLEVGGSPIVLVRGEDQAIRAFYNTCRHRGGPLVKTASGNLGSGFTCSFHGWAYDFEGNLKAVRDEADFAGLDRDCLGLIPVRCEALGQWMFITEDPDADALLDYLGPVADHFRQFDPDNNRHIASKSYVVECSVKILMETFLEVYHLNTVHPKTAGRFLDYRGSTNLLWSNGHSLMVTPNRRPDWVDPGTLGMPEFSQVSELPRTSNVSYNIFPNLVTPVSTSGVPFLVFWPLSASSLRVDCHWFSPDWGTGERHELWEQRMENFERILQEDLEFAPYLQKSVASKGFTGSRLNYQERRIYHWHEELDRRIGPQRIPAQLRVEPRLAAMQEPIKSH